MVTELIPGFAIMLAPLVFLYVTFRERALSASEVHDYAPTSTTGEERAAEPRPRDRCQCGHTYDWHHSCARDVCGCGEFRYAEAEAA